jgi:glycosyltransferase involved in cell wall biosynthesis
MLNNEFPPLGGGTGTVNLALLEKFADMPDIEIDLITSELGNIANETQFSKTIRVYKVPVNNHNIHHSSNRELLVYAYRAFFLSMKLLRQNPYDFCFAWSAVPAGGVAFLLQLFTGLRYLVRVCGPDIPGFERRYGIIYRFLTPFIKAVWKTSEVVVAKCQGEVGMINGLLSHDIHIELIPNGVDSSRFKPSSPKQKNGTIRLLCVARLIERKGQRYLIQAVKQLVMNGNNIVLDLIGTGDSEGDYRALVRKLDLENKVNFLGYIPREEIPRYYTRADIFILPSFNEGMSVATLEAMASGLPVIVTRVGGMEELVVEGVNGNFVEWGDVGGMVSHIGKFIQNRKLTSRMGSASCTRAKAFSWDRVANAYKTLFNRLNLNTSGG